MNEATPKEQLLSVAGTMAVVLRDAINNRCLIAAQKAIDNIQDLLYEAQLPEDSVRIDAGSSTDKYDRLGKVQDQVLSLLGDALKIYTDK